MAEANLNPRRFEKHKQEVKKPSRWWIAGFSIVALLYAWLVWPTPWAYGVEYWESGAAPHKKVPVKARVHRITGEKQNQGGPEGEWGRFVW